MQREEKQLDSALEAIIMRVNDLKNAIAAMIFKIEHEYETLNWPNFLDNFALISGHLTSLSKILGHDKAPNLRNLTVLPLRLSPEKDEELLRLTENRIPTFAHDLVPDYLRTKLEPQAEQKMMQLEAKAASVSIDASHDYNSDSIQMVQSGVNPVANSMMVGRPGNQQQTAGQGPLGNPPMGQMNKAPSAIKTNIKAASQIHPYR
ncbi:mediator of RNA polymerase II transcription subunit 8 isoform X3 [Monomorium pharaonis]|uniref:mediator of RNA polymerase II transcription subunit 8 isoform X3 n=1 Tax=Monomorium pharaonis TaxID=307658 RepID=UPI00102E20D7|nr:mediator of RNA polymerase II transcription subunit 8 isoform X3 [Monomorium pharaonis]